MPIDEVVDISRNRVTRRRQVLLRVGVPVLGVVLVIVSILGISLYTYRVNRASALILSKTVLGGLQGRVGAEVSGYLSPATQATLIARDMVARHAIPDERAAIEGFAGSMLNQVPHLEGFYAADGNGDFTMVRRDAKGGTDTKLIINTPGARQVSSVHLDAAGHVLDQTPAPGDDFDPRRRDWYQGALKTDGVYWSRPYIFYTTRAPGITAAIRFTRSGVVDHVFGVDITLEALSGFLASLQVGRTGHAAIIDGSGDVIAAPGLVRPAGGDAQSTVHATTDNLGDPALTAAYDRFRVDGYGSRTISLGLQRIVVIASRLPAAGQDWVLLMAAPEADFTTAADTNSRQGLLLSSITIGLATLLGLLLIRQNRRTDRTARLLAQSREVGARETRGLSVLAAQPGLFDPRQPAPGLTESLAEMSDARRASIWRLAGEGRILHCEDQFDPKHGDHQQGGHVDGLELSRSELPRFFGALDAGETIEVADAAADARTGELHRLLMRPFGSRTLLVLPVRGPRGVAGAVLLEDAREPSRSRNFAQAVSSIAAMRMAGHDQTAEASGPADAQAHPGLPPAQALMPAADGTQAFSSMLAPEASRPDGTDPAELAAQLFPSVAAMIIRFDDAASLARPDPAGVAALADDIAQAMQAIATRYALPYMKLTGHHLVAATGCTPQADGTAAARLADAALAARDACVALLAKSSAEPAFRIGIDFGAALGGVLGQEPRLFNLWGDVIHTAELMARSAVDLGSIQVSERAYAQLRQAFLFRPRGVFYVPRIGTARTFILAGRR